MSHSRYTTLSRDATRNSTISRSTGFPDLNGKEQLFSTNLPSEPSPEPEVHYIRDNVTFVLGMPHVNRDNKNYILQTIDSLFSSLSKKEDRQCLLVIFLCDADTEYNNAIARRLETVYGKYFSTGLIEILLPDHEFYQKIKLLRDSNQTVNEEQTRYVWRTKQNLDIAFLMQHTYTRGRYYVMLEDDVVVQKGFVTRMINFLQHAPRSDWIVTNFSKYTVIGTVLRSRDIPKVVNFLLLFHDTWPVDWLLEHLVNVIGCRLDLDDCSKTWGKRTLRYPVPLFNHKGKISSLKGKRVEMSDRLFRYDLGPSLGMNDWVFWHNMVPEK